MPQPINIPIPKAELAQPTPFTGLNFEGSQQAAMQGAAPLEASYEKDKAENTQNDQAAKFNQFLRSGDQGLQAYIADAAKIDPNLAQEFTNELAVIGPHIQTLKGKDRVDTTLNVVDGWHNRLSGLKVGKALQDNPNDINPALAVSGLGAKEMINAKATSIRTDATALAAKAAAGKSDAMAAYYKQLPVLKANLVEMQNRSRERAAHMRHSGSGNMQFKYKVAQEDLKSTQQDIQDLTAELSTAQDALSKSDPMVAQMNGTAQHVRDLNQQMRYLRNEKDKYQGWVNTAVEKGANSSDWQDSEASGGDTTTPPEMKPKTGVMKQPTSSDPDNILSAVIVQANPKLNGAVTPQMIQRFRQALKTDEAAAGQ